jgi:hypothetical protein
MDKLQQELLRQAVELHGEIAPPRSRASLGECFTVEHSRLIFWFNDKSGNTRVLVRERPGP